MAYKPNEYGQMIIIRRYFTAAGTSAYKVKNAAGKVITTKHRDIQHILDYLNIQVNNPVCVLNQDTSRNFLSTTNHNHKFQLFMKATRLDVLLEEYMMINNNKNKSLAKLKEQNTVSND